MAGACAAGSQAAPTTVPGGQLTSHGRSGVGTLGAGRTPLHGIYLQGALGVLLGADS